jgi:small subunit ribosomal protein S20
MPVIKQAIKKVRQDKRKTIFNMRMKRTFKDAVSTFRKNPSVKALPEVFSALDRAAKTNVIHPNKASRLKSRLSKMIVTTKTASMPAPKKAASA